MTELDEELIPLVLEVIEQYGKSLDYKVIAEPEYNVETQASNPAETPMPGIKMAPPEDVGAYSLANSLAEVGDKKILIPASYFLDKGLEPTPEDTASFDDKTWTVYRVKAYFSGELPCLYELMIR